METLVDEEVANAFHVAPGITPIASDLTLVNAARLELSEHSWGRFRCAHARNVREVGIVKDLVLQRVRSAGLVIIPIRWDRVPVRDVKLVLSVAPPLLRQARRANRALREHTACRLRLAAPDVGQVVLLRLRFLKAVRGAPPVLLERSSVQSFTAFVGDARLGRRVGVAPRIAIEEDGYLDEEWGAKKEMRATPKL
ncbi:hypothetical protein BWQ96_08052 [Gracilariopsis chorda]|uniref:Uncharacterized protein n=1 Tax=Gracilariopsis chorda TaxID=448386 RepID=A0A2V3IJF5_9FLOR|nr:hypothetical protein BWQ96_08052 [Gracilariopsis chorda]|eukprot:PXF42224.1 hypothetical protein BWQ96_08052 [Gracilariopsis chorda]